MALIRPESGFSRVNDRPPQAHRSRRAGFRADCSIRRSLLATFRRMRGASISFRGQMPCAGGPLFARLHRDLLQRALADDHHQQDELRAVVLQPRAYRSAGAVFFGNGDRLGKIRCRLRRKRPVSSCRPRPAWIPALSTQYRRAPRSKHRSSPPTVPHSGGPSLCRPDAGSFRRNSRSTTLAPAPRLCGYGDGTPGRNPGMRECLDFLQDRCAFRLVELRDGRLRRRIGKLVAEGRNRRNRQHQAG